MGCFDAFSCVGVQAEKSRQVDMNSTVTPTARVEKLRKFVPIGTATLVPSEGLDFDLYLRRQGGQTCELLLKAGLCSIGRCSSQNCS